MNDEPALRVSQLCKQYRVYDRPSDLSLELLSAGLLCRHREVPVLTDLSFMVQPGEAFGIIGHSGAGKTTLISLLSGMLIPTSGTIVRPLLTTTLFKSNAGFDPALTGRQNMDRVLSLLHHQGDDTERKKWILDFCGFGTAIDQPLRTYAAKMQSLLGYAVAISGKPDLLIVDEVLAVGDRQARKKCHDRIAELLKGGTAIVMASHKLNEISRWCSRTLLLEHGTCVAIGPTAEMVARYKAQSVLGSDEAEESDEADNPMTDNTDPADEASRIGLSRMNTSNDGRAVLIRADLLDNAGLPCGQVACGGNVELRLEFSATQRLDIPVVGWRLSNQQGTVVCETSSHLHDPPGWPSTLEPGARLRVSFCIQLPLRQGEYELGIRIGDMDPQSYAARGDDRDMSQKIRNAVVIDRIATLHLSLDTTRRPTAQSHLGMVEVPCTVSCSVITADASPGPTSIPMINALS